MRVSHGQSGQPAEQGLATPRYRKAGALLVVIGVLSALFTVLAPGAQSEPIPPGELGSFEIDGDQDEGVDGNDADRATFDWETVTTDDRITQWALVEDDGKTWLNSAKENDPTAWACNANENESTPKADLLRVYLASQITADDQFLHIGYVRQEGTGNTDINVEFNQLSAEFDPCVGDTDGRIRTAGDLLISFTFGGGVQNPATIEVFRWDKTVAADYDGDPPAPGSDSDKVPGDGHWDLVDTVFGANGADNTGPIVDHFFEGETIAARTFGEVTLNLASLFEDLLTCPGLGFATVHSRASHDMSSALMDVLPEVPFNLSDCASLDLKKVNEVGEPMEGVTFGLYTKDADGEKGALAKLPGDPPTDLTCVTTAAGICTFPRVPPGDYLIDEIDLPADHTRDPNLPFPVTVTAFEPTDLTDDLDEQCTPEPAAGCEWFVNSRLPDLHLAKDADATSVSRGDPIGFSIRVWNDGEGVASGATVTDPLPAGFDWDVDEDGSDLPAGATCSVTDATHTLSCALGNLPGGSSEASPAAVIHVVAGDTLSAPCGPYDNLAVAGAGNDQGESDPASLTLLCPGVNMVKTADDERVDAGEPIGFTLEVTNTGPGEAKDVVVTDELPGDLAWVVDEDGSDLPAGATCAIAAAGLLTCELGDLPATGDAPQVTIHLTAATAVPTGDAGIGDCAAYPNAASAGPRNGDGVTSATAVVDVRCPLAVELTKTGADSAHVGDTVAYRFTVTNTGHVDLAGVDLADGMCDPGTIVRVDDGDGDSRLEIDVDGDAAGLQREEWAYTCSRVVGVTDPDPLPNTATVSGTDADGRVTQDSASWVVDLIHPDVQVLKTVDDESPDVGQTVTYTYVVTNTGDTALSGVTVVDDRLGAIGTIETLAPGASATLTKTMVVLADSPARNVATATGSDTLGKIVTDDDDAVIGVVQVFGITEVAPVAELPRTGFPLPAVAATGLTLMLLGAGLRMSRRRHQAA